MDKKDFKEYGQSEHGNFKVVDTMGVPHPYCIGVKLVGFASDNYGGMLGEAAIEAAEKEGITCAVKGCNLTYRGHEKALLVSCKVGMKEGKVELQKYLLGIKELAESKGFAGFAFMKDKEVKSA